LHYAYKVQRKKPHMSHFRTNEKEIEMGTILLIVLLVLLFGGGGGYYAHSLYGGAGLGGVLGLVLIIAVLFWLVGGRRGA
jgi:hypothetical protein